jgi:hypothetical protein
MMIQNISQTPEILDQRNAEAHLLQARKALAFQINATPAERANLEVRHGQVWNTAELARDFEVLGFAAPFVIAKRRSDHQLGSLIFQHCPRYYFGFKADEKPIAI